MHAYYRILHNDFGNFIFVVRAVLIISKTYKSQYLTGLPFRSILQFTTVFPILGTCQPVPDPAASNHHRPPPAFDSLRYSRPALVSAYAYRQFRCSTPKINCTLLPVLSFASKGATGISLFPISSSFLSVRLPVSALCACGCATWYTTLPRPVQAGPTQSAQTSEGTDENLNKGIY